MRRTRVLRQLIADSMYVVDEAGAADAILLRARARITLADVELRNDRGARAIRSFRLEHEARSFRLSGRARSRQLQH
jgi:hypothetical protein